MTQRSRFGNLATTFPPGTSPAPSIARNVIVVTHDETNAQELVDRAEAAAEASEGFAQDSAESAAQAAQAVLAAEGHAEDAANSATEAAGYALALSHPDYGFFHDVPTDTADYGTPWT